MQFFFFLPVKEKKKEKTNVGLWKTHCPQVDKRIFAVVSFPSQGDTPWKKFPWKISDQCEITMVENYFIVLFCTLVCGAWKVLHTRSDSRLLFFLNSMSWTFPKSKNATWESSRTFVLLTVLWKSLEREAIEDCSYNYQFIKTVHKPLRKAASPPTCLRSRGHRK